MVEPVRRATRMSRAAAGSVTAMLLCAAAAGAFVGHGEVTKSSRGSLATIAGSLNGRGAWGRSPADHLVTVRAINAKTAEVTDSQRLTRSRRYSLKVPAGYHVVFGEASDLSARRHYSGHSHVIRMRAGQRRRQDLTLKPGARRIAQRAAASRAIPESAAGARGRRGGPRTKFLGFPAHIPVSGLPGARNAIVDMLVTDLSNAPPCDDGTQLGVVELIKRDLILQEIRLRNSRYADPSRRIRPRLINPRYLIRGSANYSNGNLSMQLRIVDRRTGRTVGRVESAGPGESFFDVISDLGRQLYEELCGGSVPDRWQGTVSGRDVSPSGGGPPITTWTAEVRFDQPPGAGDHHFYYATGSVTFTASGTDGEGCTYHGSETLPLSGSSEGVLSITTSDAGWAYDARIELIAGRWNFQVSCPDGGYPDDWWTPVVLDTGSQSRTVAAGTRTLAGTYSETYAEGSSSEWSWSFSG